MKKQNDVYYSAVLARDHRFDGKFFVGVKTTGIYCRPICPARPKRENVEFFTHRLGAEKAGYRPCIRCRPEAAPMSAAWIGRSAVVQRALKTIHQQDTLEMDEDDFAERFGVTARHLRRLFQLEIGKTPKQIAFENRLSLARQLTVESRLSLTEVAYAAGFQSIRRFNDAFKDRFKRRPSDLRKSRRAKPDSDLHNQTEPLRLTASYRPPYDFMSLLNSYQRHRIGELEIFSNEEMRRFVQFNGSEGWVSVRNDSSRHQLVIEIDFPDVTAIPFIVSRVRRMFDVDYDPLSFAVALEGVHETGPALEKLARKYPGLRLPSGWDPFEIAISTILGQLVSVEQARRLTSDLMENYGARSKILVNGKHLPLFPSANALAQADLTKLKTTERRKKTLRAFSLAVARGDLSLDSAQSTEDFLLKVQMIEGIGAWTAEYMALKALRDTNAFPHTDLILKRALKNYSRSMIDQLSPWRGYVAALFWNEYSQRKNP